MTADLLREAAALMRERAEAVPPSPWSTYETGTHRCIKTAIRHGRRMRQVGYATESFPEFADHAASWHPAVAIAVADWLEESAEHLEAHADSDSYPDGLREHVCPTALEGPECSVLGQSLTVARAYLGSES